MLDGSRSVAFAATSDARGASLERGPASLPLFFGCKARSDFAAARELLQARRGSTQQRTEKRMETNKDLPRRRLLKLNRQTTSGMTAEQLEAVVGGSAHNNMRPPDSQSECASITDCSYW